MIGSIPRGHPCIIRIKNPATGELDRYWALAKCPHSFDGAHEVWVPYLLGRSAGRDWVWVAQNEMHEPLACTPRFVVRAFAKLKRKYELQEHVHHSGRRA